MDNCNKRITFWQHGGDFLCCFWQRVGRCAGVASRCWISLQLLEDLKDFSVEGLCRCTFCLFGCVLGGSQVRRRAVTVRGDHWFFVLLGFAELSWRRTWWRTWRRSGVRLNNCAMWIRDAGWHGSSTLAHTGWFLCRSCIIIRGGAAVGGLTNCGRMQNAGGLVFLVLSLGHAFGLFLQEKDVSHLQGLWSTLGGITWSTCIRHTARWEMQMRVRWKL